MIKSLKNNYMKLVNAGQTLQPFVLLAIRLVWGTLFLFAGMGKIANIDQTISFFHNLNIPFHEFFAHVVAWIEAVGGALLLAGAATRLAAVPLLVIMATAFFLAHAETIAQGVDAVVVSGPVTYFTAALVLFSFGPGKLSLDFVVEKLVGLKIER